MDEYSTARRNMYDMSDVSVCGRWAVEDQCRTYPRPVLRCSDTVLYSTCPFGRGDKDCCGSYGGLENTCCTNFWCVLWVLTHIILPFTIVPCCLNNSGKKTENTMLGILLFVATFLVTSSGWCCAPFNGISIPTRTAHGTPAHDPLQIPPYGSPPQAQHHVLA